MSTEGDKVSIERRKLEHPGEEIMWVVQGDHGAVSLMTWNTSLASEPDGRMAGAVTLHHPHTDASLRANPCELLPGGVCRGDQSWRAGRELYDQYRDNRDDKVIYAELESWYRDRMGDS